MTQGFNNSLSLLKKTVYLWYAETAIHNLYWYKIVYKGLYLIGVLLIKEEIYTICPTQSPTTTKMPINTVALL